MNISVVIPLLNESQSLNELCNSICEVMSSYGFTYENILIDDGSTDESWEVIQKLSKKSDDFKGIKIKRNFSRNTPLLKQAQSII